jgi:type II secretory pathway pseudopilin PulG
MEIIKRARALLRLTLKMAALLGRRSVSLQAFTITEAVVALTIIGIGIGSMITSMGQLNQEASVSRNATGADAALQNQIDLLLSDGPFNPQKTGSDGQPQIPPELTVGTHTTNNVPIYREPNTGVIVFGTMTTTITDISETYLGQTLYKYQATVAISYNYRNRTYTASRSTIRTSDI